MKKLFILCCCSVVIFACSKKTAPTTTTTTTQTITATTAKLDENNVEITASAEDLAKGKELVALNCVKCHKEPIPADHSRQKWMNVLTSMLNKAHIVDEAQKKLIHDYVYSNLK